jgi:hypothetical protein
MAIKPTPPSLAAKILQNVTAGAVGAGVQLCGGLKQTLEMFADFEGGSP